MINVEIWRTNMFLDMKKISKISCEKLQDFFVIDQQIENLKSQLEFEENNKDVNSFIKSKNKRGNTVENKVMRKIMIENKINEKIIWKEIIGDIIEGYRKNYKPKYDYIIEKFMNHKTDQDIAQELFMANNTQYRYKLEISYHIAIIAVSKNLILISEVEKKM